MPDVIIIQSNPATLIDILDLPVPGTSDLSYQAGGGSLFPNLQNDYVKGGKVWHKGNPIIPLDITTKSCNAATFKTEKITVNSGKITKGLFSYDSTAQKYYWDEVYTSPLGQFQAVDQGASLTGYQFKFTSNNSEEIYLSTQDVNIVPKVGDYIVIQKASGTATNDSYTDDVNSLQANVLAETYQFKVKIVTINSINGASTIYKLTLDKSFKPVVSGFYNLVLLNRLNTGIQKELFYDTFAQIEIHREQLLGDPYNNISDSTKPSGRKNYLNYATSVNLGLATLLHGIINQNTTPIISFDIANDIKDKFLSTQGQFEIILPFVMVQTDTRTMPELLKPNRITNQGAIFNDTKSIGTYSGLYFDWDTNLTNRVGWVFYDLRVVVFDDSEIVTALSYNSNRNFTLPAPVLKANFGNTTKNPGGGLDIEITNVTNTSPIEITTITPHNLVDGTAIFISGVTVTDTGGSTISSSANGFHYIKLVYPNGPALPPDPNKFTLWDVSLTTPVSGNGIFVKSTSGSSGVVLGTLPEYKYFFTYRLRGTHYTSMAPYSQVTKFNFASNGKVDDTSAGQLNFSIDTLKFLIDIVNTSGYSANDIEVIIGRYLNADSNHPNIVTGFTDVVSIPLSELTFPRQLISSSTHLQLSLQNIVVSKQDYLNFVAKIGGSGAYDKNTNTSGNPSFDIKSNYALYSYASGNPVPNTLVTGEGLWTLANISFKNSINQYRSFVEISIPAGKWNDSTNPTYDPNNTFISDRFITEVAILLEGDADEKPMLYAKLAPAIRKSNDLDLTLILNLDF